MKIFIVGLGLMGSSYAEKLTEKGHEVYGYDINEETLKIAVNEKIIKEDLDVKNISQSELVILCLYPEDNINFIKTYKHLFNENQLITDISGTKVYMLNEISKILPEHIKYVSHHPMAGREKKGILNRNKEMFKNANFIIINDKKRSNEIMILKGIAKDLGFGNTLVATAKKHDDLIAFTSQLTHVLAVALVNTDKDKDTKKATGDSYRDLTRIAKINEVMWTELFLENKNALLKQIKAFKKEMNLLEKAIKENDVNTLHNKLISAREKRLSFDEN